MSPEKYNELLAHSEQIDAILLQGAEKARALAAPMLERVKWNIRRYT